MLFAVIGAAGLVLPVLPGTLFLILSAFCFARSSPRLERWLLEHPRLGQPIDAWRRTGAIPVKAKFVALASMAASVVFVAATAPPIGAVAASLAIAASAIYVATRPSA